MAREDANLLALKTVRRILSGARPGTVTVGEHEVGYQVTAESVDWPQKDLGGANAETAGEWPDAVLVQCTWPGGAVGLHLRAWFFQTKSDLSRHAIALQVRVAGRSRELVWINIRTQVGDAADGEQVRLYATARMQKRGTWAQETEDFREVLAGALADSGMPLLTSTRVEVCNLRVPECEPLPSPEKAFERVVRVALYKLDFFDYGRVAERGTPLFELPNLLPTTADITAEPDDDTDDGADLSDAKPRRYWGAGFGEPDKLEDFLKNDRWVIGWGPDATSSAGQRAWSRFLKISVGDWMVIKGYGGTHTLKVHYVGEVTEVDPGEQTVHLRKLNLPHYHGDAPSGHGAGSWRDTLVPVERPDVVELLFGEDTEASAPEHPAEDLGPRNVILYGPPGTGKTYRLSTHYQPKFTRHLRDRTRLLNEDEFIGTLSWFQVLVLALEDLQNATVPQLAKHPLVLSKYASTGIKSLNARIWGVLQSHAVETSKTVNYASKSGELVFDKSEDSVWRFEPERPESAKELRAQLDEIRQTNAKRNISRDYAFVTFHQSYAYEDFLEGLRPRIDDEESDTGMSYTLEDGVFKTAVRNALRLAGWQGTIDDLCQIPRGERTKLFLAAPPYALFIDEINRGNVASILGELITLIEGDKRLGEAHEVIVTLPYSKTRFGVPPNLHIIGTMNTADRSVEALDSALRRRFSFVECAPDPSVVAFELPGKIDVGRLLRTINRRIAKLLDRDHMIGHAYFKPLASDGDLDDLKEVFANKIIPLLREYFFGDWGQIGLVLGADFVRRIDTEVEFAKFDHEALDELNDRPTYELTPPSQWTNRSFRRIYGDEAEDD